MNFNSFKNATVAAAQNFGLEEYELYFQCVEATTVAAYKDEINQFTSANEGGVCFRCIVDGKMGYASTEDLRPETAAGLVARAVDNAKVLETQEQVFLAPGGQNYRKWAGKNYKMPGAQHLIEKTLQTQKCLYDTDPMVTDGTITKGVAEKNSIAIYNSKGLDIKTETVINALVVGAVVSDGKEKVNDYQIKVGQLDQVDIQALAEKSVTAAKSKLGAVKAPTGVYPVAFAPEAMADLLDVFSDVFSSDAAQKGLSKLADREGEIIASEAVTLVDDPFYPDSPMPMVFDGEGSPTFRKTVIEKGRLNTLLYNMKTANVAGKKTTGNGSKGTYHATINISPFTLYLENGDMTEEALLAAAGNGLYINALSGLHAGANPITGDFSLQSAGFLVENGQKTKPVKGFTVAGNFYDLLKNIKALANNCRLPMATGMCAFGAPTTLVEGLSIAGE